MTLLRVLIFLIVFQCYSQKLGQSCQEDMIPSFDKPTRTYGYRNLFGEWKVPAAYTKVYPFVGNKAIVMKGSKLGVINCDGYLIVDAIYDDFAVFNLNKVWAKKDGLWGFINDKGGIIIKPSFNEIKKISPQGDYVWIKKGDFWGIFSEKSLNFVAKPIFQAYTRVSNEVSLVQLNDSLGVIDHETGAFLIPPKITNAEKISAKNFAIQLNGKWGLLNEHAQQITPIEYDSIALMTPSVVLAKKDGHYGLLNTQGKIITPIAYDQIRAFYEGQASLSIKGKWGTVHQTGRIIIEPQYESLARFKKSLAIAKLNGKYGLVDYLNKIVVPFSYDALNIDYKNTFYSGLKNGKYSFLGLKGEKLNELEADSIYYGDSTDFVRIKTTEGIKFYNLNTKSYLFASAYESASAFTNGVSTVTLNNKFGIVNTKGDKIVEVIYDSITYDNLAGNLIFITTTNKKIGVISHTGKPMLATEYDLISNCDQRFLKCKKENFYGILKNNGEPYVPFEYDFLSNKNQNPLWPSFPTVFLKGKKTGFINFNGEEIYSTNGSITFIGEGLYLLTNKNKKQILKPDGQALALEIDDAEGFSEKLCAVQQDGKYGYITVTGNWAIKPLYEEAGNFIDKLAVVKLNGKYGVVDKVGKWIIKADYDSTEINKSKRFLIKESIKYQILSSGRLNRL